MLRISAFHWYVVVDEVKKKKKVNPHQHFGNAKVLGKASLQTKEAVIKL